MWSKIKILVCLVTILLFTSIGISSEYLISDFQKLDPKLALMLTRPELKPLVYVEMTGKQFLPTTTKINVLIKTSLDRTALGKFGIKAHTRIGDIITATIPIDLIPGLLTHPQISYIQGPRPVSIHNDVSVPEIGATQVRQQFNLSGSGVIIGIVDTGIDWKHQDFRNANGTTRILALLDFSDPGDVNGDGDLDGPDQYGGTLYTEQEINNALNGMGTVNEKDIVGHGTHVAGSAAGNGRATGNGVPANTYLGVAPQADLIIIKATRERGGINFEPTDYINAIAFIDSVARIRNKPYVVNLSLGGSLGPHDGKDLSEQAIDALLSGADSQGKAVVVSAGNEGEKNIHASGTFGSGTTEIDTKFSVPSFTPNTGNMNDYVLFEGWYKAIYSYSIKIITPDGTTYGPISSGREGGYDTDNGAIYIANALGGPSSLNGDKQILVQIYDFKDTKTPKQGEWKIVILGSAGRFDLWIAGSSMDASLTSNIDPTMILGTPGTAFNAITVGSYITKARWTDLDRHSVYVPGLILGDISAFSSPGPTRDGRTKPEICAPGEKIAASYSTDAPPTGEYSIFKSNNSQLPNGFICQDGKHAVTQGTSFAAPHVSGVIALMLQKNPQLTVAQIRTALIKSARADQYTLVVPNNNWGYGKIDALAALQFITGQSQEKKFTVSIFQNPVLTQYIDFYLISKYTLQSVPNATIKVGSSSPENITMAAIESNIYKGEYQFTTDGTATLTINATIQGQSDTTVVEYFGVKLLRQNYGGFIAFDEISLSVPPAGLHNDTYLTIVPDEITETNDINLQEVSQAYKLGPSNCAFVQPATLTFAYESVSSRDESKIGIYVYENNEWKRLSSSIEKSTKTVSAQINQLGTFKLYYDPGLQISENLPTTFKLYQNYPNPFNATTTIEYQIPHDSQISIKIFSLDGKLVKTLFNGEQRAGYHKILWDGKNIIDLPASSGLYICQFDAKNFVMTRKMLLLK